MIVSNNFGLYTCIYVYIYRWSSLHGSTKTTTSTKLEPSWCTKGPSRYSIPTGWAKQVVMGKIRDNFKLSCLFNCSFIPLFSLIFGVNPPPQFFRGIFFIFTYIHIILCYILCCNCLVIKHLFSVLIRRLCNHTYNA